MARDTNDIERDIERTRGQLASTLDEIAQRANPSNLADTAKDQAAGWLKDEAVQKVLAGIGVGIATLVAVRFFNGRKRKKELKELQKLLASR
ncbi:hypothetical protein CAPI_02790 [Corynebacterium capitovis DSM 44611]|uniref:DUF3618 domain-containing protein n=1 Tax=Corynebacterium capitovis TaxID=131081 RepID=UPI000374BD51|nr:DUF3618 domain-containing protein [Corynebacterium capitovis]WKD57125.1 hypothetical protein CAPI_02790 [Corynebacterium capitovis DSM 44611]